MVGKSLPYWHAKSWDCLLTHWLPIKGIVFLIETISRYQFWCNYPRKKNYLFFTAFLKCRLNFQYFEKKMTFIDFVIWKLGNSKTYWEKCLKSLVPESPSRSNMVNVLKTSWNLPHSRFIIFIDHCQLNWLGKSLRHWHGKSWHCFLTDWCRWKLSSS